MRSGATNPTPLLKLLKAGVRIYRRDHLHAKVYLFDRTLIVGSANVSQSSATRRVEACLMTTEASTRKRAMQFIDSLCTSSMLVGEEYLTACLADYRPSKFPSGPRSKRSHAAATLPGSSLWYLPNLIYDERDDETEALASNAENEAADDLSDLRKCEPHTITFSGNPKFLSKLCRGDNIISATLDKDTDQVDISHPMPFIRIKSGKRKNGSAIKVIVLEKRKRSSRVLIQEFRRTIPKFARAYFSDEARIKKISSLDVAEAVLGVWTDAGRLRKKQVSG